MNGVKLGTNHTVGSATAAVAVGWSVSYAIYIAFVSLLVLGPRDFNGDPNTLTTNIVGGALLAATVAQAILAVMLAKRRTEKLLVLLPVLAGAVFIVASVGLGRTFIPTFTPLHLNLAILLLLFGGHRLFARPRDAEAGNLPKKRA